LKVFITGSSGFIGRALVNFLVSRKEYQVLGYDLVENPDQDLRRFCVKGNILDVDLLKSTISSFSPDVIVHLAARCDLGGKDLNDYEANTIGVKNICEAASTSPNLRKTIFTSSQLVCRVGQVPKDFNSYCPNTIYGESKVLGEKIVKENDGGKLTWCITRPTTVWGPQMGEHYQSLLSHIYNGTYFHSGKAPLFKSYSYIGNIVYQYFQLILASNDSIHKKTFYLADYEPLSLRAYINGIANEMNVKKPKTVPLSICYILAKTFDVLNKFGIKIPYNSFRLKNIITEYIFDLSETKKVCGKLPFNSEEGVKKTAQWFVDIKNT
jgi:nucleoside-diphosphate-sugar epimerase